MENNVVALEENEIDSKNDNLESGDSLNTILGSAAEGNQYLSFMVANEEYGISILKVKEIIGLKKITMIPNLPDYIKGVVNLRGNIIHIIDIRERFKMETIEYDKFTVIIIVEAKEKTVGMIVDRVEDVLNVENENIQAKIDFESSIDSDYIDGMAKVGERLVIMLDIDRLIEAS